MCRVLHNRKKNLQLGALVGQLDAPVIREPFSRQPQDGALTKADLLLSIHHNHSLKL